VFGCNNEKDITDDFVTIKAESGLYVSAQSPSGNQLVADRQSWGEWEKFIIEVQKESKIKLKASNYSYVGTKPQLNNNLVADFQKSDNNTTFKLIKIDSGQYVFKNWQNRFVSLDSNQLLTANKSSLNEATVFIIDKSPVKKYSYFTTSQLSPLITGIVLIFISLISFQYKKERVSISLLLMGGFCVRLFVALLDPHLSLWDEQFHALVAKNMMEHPFKPMLYETHVLPFDKTSWVDGHIWLHKQPLFLWQMALSMKIFGANIFGLRLPSILMSTLVILIIYRVGKITINEKAGFFGALLFAVSNFALEITAGAMHTDHNDVAFLFYISASIWAWVEYENSNHSRKKYFLLLIGLFAGCAVLVKWLIGLLVFAGWALTIILIKERRNQLRNYINLFKSLSITLAVFVPWQVYILNIFPEISKYEFNLNTQHFFEVVEKHGGNFWWHFDKADEIYGISIYFIIFSITLLAFRLKDKAYKIGLISYICIIYIFYGIAATKMIAFTYCIALLIFLSFGTFFERFFNVIILNPKYFPKKIHNVFFTTVIMGIISGLSLNIEKIQENHTMWKKDESSRYYQKLKSTSVIKQLPEKIDDIEHAVIFNCKPFEGIPVMFFNDVVAAYSRVPDQEAYERLKAQGYKIAVFDDGNLPPYLKSDKEVTKILGYW
jgi:4-amino-4-deoxy-L-arabinose transferase